MDVGQVSPPNKDQLGQICHIPEVNVYTACCSFINRHSQETYFCAGYHQTCA